MRIRFLSSALLVSALSGLPIAATSSAQSNFAVAQLPDSHPSQLKAPAAPDPQPRAKLAANYGKLPISFEANRGQTDKRMSFIARGSGYGLYLNGQEAVLALHAPQPKESSSGTGLQAKFHALPSFKTDVVRMQLRNANPAAQPVGIDALPGTANYFVGKDPSKWLTAIPTYSRVKFSGVYPGIDVVYYGNQRQLEYDFVVAPKGDPQAIRLHFAGARKLSVIKDGDLFISAKDGQIAFHKPVIYQEKNGQRQPVEGHFTLLADRSVGFALGRYDRSQPLVIDPSLIYSTYLTGTNPDTSVANSNGASAIAIDSAGNAYVTGGASPNDFPVTPGAFQTCCSGAFITKFNATGTALLYSTYLGGVGSETIAIDSQGNAYIGGSLSPGSFPVTPGALQTTSHATNSGYVTKLNPTGTGLVYSTYLSGSVFDQVSSIVIDGQGDAYVAGVTGSLDFPVTPGAYQTGTKGAPNTAFIAELNPAGNSLVYATYLGGSYLSGVNALALDSAENIYAIGWTYCTDFPLTPGAFQTTNEKKNNETGFITKLNSTGTDLLYSTYLGGSQLDSLNGIEVDGSGNAYVTGGTYSPDFPVTAGAFQTVRKNGVDTGFITKLNPTGTGLVYSTYLGGSASSRGAGDWLDAIALDDTGSVYVTGVTGSADFPVTPDALQAQKSGTPAFITRLDPSGTKLLYSTYIGGSAQDTGEGIAVDNKGNVYIVGKTYSKDYPVTPGAFQTVNNASYGSAFVSKLNLEASSTITSSTTTLTADGNPQTLGVPITFTATVAGRDFNLIPEGDMIFSVGGTPVATVPLEVGTAVWETSNLPAGTHPIRASYSGDSNFRPSSGLVFETVVFPLIDFAPKAGQYAGHLLVTLSANPSNSTIYYTLDGSNPTAASPVYTGPISLGVGTITVAAREVLSDGSLSLVSEATYDIVPATPTPILHPASGSYPAGQQVTITDAATATIYYTTDGSIPTTQSPVYTGPITLTPGSETIRAIAISSGSTPSVPNSATYTTP